jgi:murein DD-endopeptidase
VRQLIIRGWVLAVCAIGSASSGCGWLAQPVEVSAPFAPVTFTLNTTKEQLVYELHVANKEKVDITLTSLKVAAPELVLAEYKDVELQRRITRPSLPHDHATPQVIGPGMTAVVNLWIEVPRRFAGGEVTHTVQFEAQQSSGRVPGTAEGAVTVRRPQAPLELAPPLKGGFWIAVYDPALKGGHRTALYTTEGRPRIPGRFAIDFITLPPTGTWTRNPSPRPLDWNGFGSDVLAVADGTIAAAADGTADDLPQPVPRERAAGNYVTIDLGEGRFAFYEHLQQGSIAVKPGDQVKRGQVIAKLGSSGSTSIGPHLHFHVADANSLLDAEGVPFVFDRYTVFGQFKSLDGLVNGEKWQPNDLARPSATTRPAPNTVVAFR